MTLRSRMVTAVESQRGLAMNPYFHFAIQAAEFVESRIDMISELVPYVAELEEMIIRDPDIAIHGPATNAFMQKLGEAHFLAVCTDHGVQLDRVPETRDVKTPDFALRSSNCQMHFEVKTLSVVNGDHGIHDALEETLGAEVAIEQQVLNGQVVSIGEAVIAPYGARGERGTLLSVADVILEKARRNVKQDQFSRSTTFLVLNMFLLQTPPGGAGNLSKVFDYQAPHECTPSGALWSVAFGLPEDTFIDISEFEGDDRNTFDFQKRGLLVDEEFECVAGILFLVHPWDRQAEMWALWRSRSAEQWRVSGDDCVLNALVGGQWNDDLDQNAAVLSSKFARS